MYLSFESAAALCGLLAYVLMIHELVKTQASMNIATWVIWTTLDAAAFASAFNAGERIPWMIGVFTIGAGIIAVLSLRNGSWHWSWLETACTFAVFISLGLWFTSPLWTLIASSLAMFVGGIPQLVDAYHEPSTQNKRNWILFLVSNMLSLLGANYALAGEWFYPVLGMIFNSVMLSILIFSPRRV